MRYYQQLETKSLLCICKKLQIQGGSPRIHIEFSHIPPPQNPPKFEPHESPGETDKPIHLGTPNRSSGQQVASSYVWRWKMSHVHSLSHPSHSWLVNPRQGHQNKPGNQATYDCNGTLSIPENPHNIVCTCSPPSGSPRAIHNGSVYWGNNLALRQKPSPRGLVDHQTA